MTDACFDDIDDVAVKTKETLARWRERGRGVCPQDESHPAGQTGIFALLCRFAPPRVSIKNAGIFSWEPRLPLVGGGGIRCCLKDFFARQILMVA